MLAGNAAPEGAAPVAQAYAGHQFGGYSAAPRRRPRAAARRGARRPRAPPRPAPEGLGAHAVRARRRRQGGRRPDAARVRDRRGDARARHPDDPRARRGGDRRRRSRARRCCPARCSSASRRATSASARSSTPRRRRLRRSCSASPTTRSPATTRRRPRRRTRTSRFFEAVVDAQASLIARWMLVGFIHGVMNTDNMTISGETIDYGPCAFMDAFDPATVFSSIDHGGRYAYGNQPPIAQWNLARLAETLLPLVDADPDAAVAAGRRRAGVVPRPLPRPLAARDAREARPRRQRGRGRRRSSTTCSRCCRHSASTSRRSSARCPRRPAATRRPRERCSPSPPRSTRGPSAGARACRRRPPSRTRSPTRWTASTRSTSRATTSSRRRWRRRPPATSSRSQQLVDVLAAPVRRAPRPRGATPPRPRRASATSTARSAGHRAHGPASVGLQG